MQHTPSISPSDFTTFGAFLKYLRKRAQLTQTSLAIACNYSTPQISRLENNQRIPDQATLLALFVPALGLEDEPDLVTQLLELAVDARREPSPLLVETTSITSIPISRSLPITSEQRNRYAMLQNVRKFWIEGVLENSLYVATLIELGLKVPIEAVDNPWETLLRKSGTTDETLPSGTRIIDVFEQLNGKLLILGDPGSGKTTSLIELARDLLVYAEADDAHPIPVVLNLSSWSEERKPLADWLIDELNCKYLVPKRVALQWLETDTLLLLLDGLDEVTLQYRDNCVQAINNYRQEHGFADLVVSSRTADYDALTTRLRLNGAIVIQPLDDKQVDQYLGRLGPEMSVVRKMLGKDESLIELSRSPLMLSILVLAYRGQDDKNLPRFDTFERQRKHLFDVYVQRMFERRSGETQYTQQETIHYLSWLARGMKEHSQSVFQIEKMQPSLLSGKQRNSFYLQVRLVSMIAMALLYGIPFVPFAFALKVNWWIFASLHALNGTIFAWLFSGSNWSSLPGFVLNGLSGGLAWGLSVGLAYGAVRGLGVGGAALLIYFLGPFITSRILKQLAHNREYITLPEALHFSRTRVKIVVGLAGGIMGILAVLGNAWAFGGLELEPINLILGMLGGGLIFGVSYGFQSGLSSTDVDYHAKPNQGIWASLNNANRAALGTALQFLLTGLFGLSLILGLGPGLSFGITMAIYLGYTFWFIYGGYSVIQHFILRRILQNVGAIPLRLAEFLNQSTSSLFLRRVGGGYIFIHRYLLEYFAALEENGQ